MDFNINFLDHVAIKVEDVDISADWYARVLGLEKCTYPEWGNRPVMMMSGNFGVALFPIAGFGNDDAKSIRIDHFAFNISRPDFEKALKYFDAIGEKYEFQDHVYFHSIYLKDPDKHKVELTTAVSHPQ